MNERVTVKETVKEGISGYKMSAIYNKKGFTLIELIIVIAIIAIFAIIAMPLITKYTAKAEITVCNENRGMISRMYNIHKMYHPETNFEDFLSSEYGDKALCPKNGDYTYESGKIACSYHDEESIGSEDPWKIIFPDDHYAASTGSWEEVMEKAASSPGGGTSVSKGEIFYDETGHYIIITPEWVRKDTVLCEYENAVKLKTDSILTADDIISGYSPTWKDGIYLTAGMVRLHSDGYLYAYIDKDKDASGTWAGIDATWSKLTSL